MSMASRRGTRLLVGSSHPIPRAVYDSVLHMSVAIVKATGCGKPRERSRAYRRLKRFCLSTAHRGVATAFLLETLADFTSPRRIAIPLYRRALRAARQAGDQEHTILISLAERLVERRQMAEAAKCLRMAARNAKRWLDSEDYLAATRLLRALRQPGLSPHAFARLMVAPEENDAA